MMNHNWKSSAASPGRTGIHYLAAGLLLAFIPVTSAAQLPAEPEGLVFKMTGNWTGSGLSGHSHDTPTYWTTETDAEAIWKPGFDGPVRARVYLHGIVHVRDNDPAVPVTVYHGNESESRTMNFDEGTSGWHFIGEYEFSGEPTEGVRLRRTTQGHPITRASAVRFDVLTDATPPTVIQSVLIDTPTHGAMAEDEDWEPELITFTDLPETPHQPIIERLATRGYIFADDEEHFHPEQDILIGDWAIWLHRCLNQVREPQAWQGHRSPDAYEEAAAMEVYAELFGTIMKSEHAALPMKRDTLKESLRRAADSSGRLLHHPFLIEDTSKDADVDGTITRAEASALLWKFVQQVVEAGPPLHTAWDVTFTEEFEGTELNTEVWSIEAGSPGHILSSRWPENVEVRGGHLHLLTRMEDRGGRSWTTGNIWTRHFEQKYGYFEARMKIGTATGLNNAFWLMTHPNAHPDYHYEIDITEARYPNKHHMTVHNWKGQHTASGRTYFAPENLSEDFHVYGLEWNEDTIIWYLNGIPVRTVEHDYCRAASPIRLSSAIGRFAGRIVDELDGTSQVVDWVRIYQYPGNNFQSNSK